MSELNTAIARLGLVEQECHAAALGGVVCLEEAPAAQLARDIRLLLDTVHSQFAALERSVQLLVKTTHVIEPFATYFTPNPGYLPDSARITAGSPMAKKQVTAGDFRAVVELAAKLKQELLA